MNLRLTAKFINSNYLSATCTKKSLIYMYYQNIPTEVYIIYDKCSSVNFVQEGSFNEIEKKLRIYYKFFCARRPSVCRQAMDEFGPTTIPLISLQKSGNQRGKNKPASRLVADCRDY